MSAAIAPINTPEKLGQFIEGLVVAAGKVVYAGTLGALDASGNVVPASDTAGLTVAGRIEALPLYDTFGAGAAVLIKRGTFKFNNSTTNALAVANIGDVVYAEDDNTVASTTTNKVKAGKMVGLDSDGVWVDTTVFPQPITPTSATVTTTAAVDLSTSEALANALKTAVNALVADVATLAAKLS